MKSNWLDKTVSLYKTHADNTGTPTTYRDIFNAKFAKDLPAIISLRKLDRTATDYKIQAKPIKSKLQCYTPAALLESKATGNVIELHRTGIMQLDFDEKDICMYGLEELKACIFDLTFIGYCGLSCSGGGFYALALIAEPERLSEYAEHCFNVLLKFGIKADTSKGKKVENLRYMSYDANMLLRENPTPLKLRLFKAKPAALNPQPYKYTTSNISSNNTLLNNGLRALEGVQSGERWQTVQKVAFTIGGLNNRAHLQQLISAINGNSAFAGEEKKYCECAINRFNAGALQPLTPIHQASRPTAQQDFAKYL